MYKQKLWREGVEASVGTSFGKVCGQAPKQYRKGGEGPEMVGLGRTSKDNATQITLDIVGGHQRFYAFGSLQQRFLCFRLFCTGGLYVFK